MGAVNPSQNTGSFARSQPDLAQNAPVSLKKLRSLQIPFDHARSPEISAQLNDLGKSEKERREDGERGSRMVKQHHPYPELRPKHTLGPKRTSFDQAWLREQRAAKLAQYQDEYVSNRQNQEQSQEILPFTPSMAR